MTHFDCISMGCPAAKGSVQECAKYRNCPMALALSKKFKEEQKEVNKAK